MSTATVSTNRRTLYIPEDKDLKIRLIAALQKKSVNELINDILNEGLKAMSAEDLTAHIIANE